jgi:hypothetical protein
LSNLRLSGGAGIARLHEIATPLLICSIAVLNAAVVAVGLPVSIRNAWVVPPATAPDSSSTWCPARH